MGCAGALQVRPCKLGRRLLVCAVLRTRQNQVGRPAQPARGMPRAHAAHAPAQPIYPATDRLPCASTHGKKRRSKAKAAWQAAICRAEPMLGFADPRKGAERGLGSTRASAALRSAVDFLFLLRGWQTAKICLRPVGLGTRGVSRMDAAAKPPGTDSRRPRVLTRPAHPRLLLSETPRHHPRGLRRWLETLSPCTGRCPRTAITSPIPASSDTAEVPP